MKGTEYSYSYEVAMKTPPLLFLPHGYRGLATDGERARRVRRAIIADGHGQERFCGLEKTCILVTGTTAVCDMTCCIKASLIICSVLPAPGCSGGARTSIPVSVIFLWPLERLRLESGELSTFYHVKSEKTKKQLFTYNTLYVRITIRTYDTYVRIVYSCVPYVRIKVPGDLCVGNVLTRAQGLYDDNDGTSHSLDG